MKQTVLLYLVLATTICNAQNFIHQISFSDYEEWTQNISIPGYKFYAIDKEGEAEYNEEIKYKANFIKGQTDRVSINLTSINNYASFLNTASQKGEHEFEKNGYKMVYIPLNAKYSSAFLTVKIPESEACLTLHFVPLKSKEEALDIFSKLDLKKLKK